MFTAKGAKNTKGEEENMDFIRSHPGGAGDRLWVNREGREEREGGERRGGMVFEPLSPQVIGCSSEVHRFLGPGLLESTYEHCLARELSLNGVRFATQVALPVEYKGVKLDCGYRLDMLIEEQLIVEIKAVTELEAIHEAQVITYMKLSGYKTALLINFNVRKLRDGIKRFVHTN